MSYAEPVQKFSEIPKENILGIEQYGNRYMEVLYKHPKGNLYVIQMFHKETDQAVSLTKTISSISS